MLVLLFFSILALFFTYLESLGKIRHGLWLGVFLVTVISAIHYNYGSDYSAYYQIYMDFIEDRQSLIKLIFVRDGAKYEPGWLLTMALFKPLGIGGFYVMVAALSIFQGVVVFRLIKRYLPAQLYLLALFIYLFNTNIYVGSFSGIRQHFAMAIIACSLSFILEKRWFFALLVILIATSVHTSAIIFLPFAFWGFVPNSPKLMTMMYALVCVVLFIKNSIVQNISDLFFEIENFQIYQSYAEEEENASFGLGFIVSLIPFVLSLIYMFTSSNNSNIFKIVALATISFVLLPITTTIHLSVRMAYYFEIFSIISIPYAFSIIENKSIRIPFTSLYALYLVYSYYQYFHGELRYESTYIYHSLFELLF